MNNISYYIEAYPLIHDLLNRIVLHRITFQQHTRRQRVQYSRVKECSQVEPAH